MKSGLFSCLLAMLISLQVMGNHADTLQIVKLLKECQTVYEQDNKKGIEKYHGLITLADSSGFMNDSIASVKTILSGYEYYRGRTAEAIKLSLSALHYYREKKNLKGMVKALSLTGDILRGNNLYDQSYTYLNEAKAIAGTLADSLSHAYVINRLAAVYYEDRRIPDDSVERYAMNSLRIARNKSADALIYNNLNILGALETRRGNFDHSIKYLKESYLLTLKSFKEDEPLVLVNLARNYFQLNDLSKATELNLKAFNLAEKLNIPQYTRLSSVNLEMIYRKKGDYKQAHRYAVIYYQAKESILTQKVQVQLEEFNDKIAIEQQRSENQRLQYEQKLTEGRLRNFMIIGVLLLMVLVGVIVFLVYQNRQRKRIHQIASQLEQSNKVLTRFISILGHDLRSPFNALLGFTDLLKNDTDSTEEDRQHYIDNLYSVSRSAFKLLESILEWSRLQSGSVQPVKKTFDLSELISDSIEVLEHTASLKKIEIVYANSVPAPIWADYDMIFTAIRNILSNAIKFTHFGGNVKIKVSKENGQSRIEICDNGIGIAPENIEKLFRIDENYKSQGTAGEYGTGFGLILCRDYIAIHNGSLEVNSKVGEGSTFVISLPDGKNDQPTGASDTVRSEKDTDRSGLAKT
jgi:signal transduction histidine kinase